MPILVQQSPVTIKQQPQDTSSDAFQPPPLGNYRPQYKDRQFRSLPWLPFYPGYHFSGNLEMSEFAKVREKSGKGLGICVVRKIQSWQLSRITCLHFICTVVHFLYVISAENLD